MNSLCVSDLTMSVEHSAKKKKVGTTVQLSSRSFIMVNQKICSLNGLNLMGMLLCLCRKAYKRRAGSKITVFWFPFLLSYFLTPTWSIGLLLFIPSFSIYGYFLCFCPCSERHFASLSFKCSFPGFARTTLLPLTFWCTC